MVTEERDFFEVFDASDCKFFPPNNYSALQKWMKVAPVYRPCTFLAEMTVYLLVVCVAISATVTILTKKYRKEMKQKETQRLSSSMKLVSGGPPTSAAFEPTKFSSDDKTVIDSVDDARKEASENDFFIQKAKADKTRNKNENSDANDRTATPALRWRSTEVLRQIGNDENERVETVMAIEYRDGVDAESEAFCIDDVVGVESDRRGDNENQNAAGGQCCFGLKKAFAKIGQRLRREKKEPDYDESADSAATPGQRLVYQLTVSLICIPILAYVFLLFIFGLGIIPAVIKSMIVAPPAHDCDRRGFQNVKNYKPVAYKLKNSNYELAIGKLERNKTGYLADLKYTMLYTYGKSCSVSNVLGRITDYASHGIEVYLWDLPGFGFSSGPQTPEDFVSAAKLVVDFVVEKTGKPAEEILLFGHSMGGAIAAITANQIKSRRLILFNPLDALANSLVDGCVMTGFVGGPVSLANFLDARSAHKEFARSGGCLLLVAAQQDEMIMYQRHRETFLRFYENSPTQCGVMVSEKNFDHNANEWSSTMYVNAIPKFLSKECYRK